MRKNNKKRRVAAVATMTALSVACSNVYTTSVLFAKDVKADGQVSLLADEKYVFEGNMLTNPGFDEGTTGWTGNRFGTASNNPVNATSGTHYWTDGGDGCWVGQTVKVPYTGYYKVSTWASQGGSGAFIGVKNETTGEEQKVNIDETGSYAKYELTVWLNQGDEVKIWAESGGTWWLNGDDFSLTYDTTNLANVVANPKFESNDAWELSGDASIADGQAVLTGAADSISQDINIPLNGPYYVEVVLEGAENATVTFDDVVSEAVTGNQTVRIEKAGLTGHDARTLEIAGKATVKSVTVKFDEEHFENTAPVADNLGMTGEAVVDAPLEAVYDFEDADKQPEGATKIQWFIGDSADGEFEAIDGAKKLVVKEEWAGKYLKFTVTPVDLWGTEGEAVTSEAVGPVNVNSIPGVAFKNKATIGMYQTESRTVIVEESGYYDLFAFVNYSGVKEDGKLTLEDEKGNVLASVAVSKTNGSEEIKADKAVLLEKGQKVVVSLKGASDKNFGLNNAYLVRENEAKVPSFNNVVEMTTAPETYKTVIDRENKEVILTYLHGTDVSNVKVETVAYSDGATGTINAGDILNLKDYDKKATVTGTDGKKETWTIRAKFTNKKVQMSSSNKELTDTFNWAAYKMDQYIMTGKKGVTNKDENNIGGDGTGLHEYAPSYWAGYWDRTAYYSRDFVHQATGGQIAGLEEENFNMFYTFAKNCTESRKYYTLWCFNFDGSPHTIDYYDDEWFVREVPAQFELVEKAYKQYLWSGDRRYVDDPVMFDFYTNVMTKYVELHDTNGNGVAEGTGGGIFQGTSSYNELPGAGEHFIESGDSIGSQYQATLAYAGILRARGDEAGAKEWEKKAADLKDYFNNEWSLMPDGSKDSYVRGWDKYTDEETGTNKKHTGFGAENSWFMPMKLITEPGERNDAYMDMILERLGTGMGYEGAPRNIEAYTYIPDMLFPYNRNEDAWHWMKYIASVRDNPHLRPSQGTNGDYPEISFTYVSHVVEGMMGVEPNAVEGTIATSPRLPQEVPDTTVRYMDIGDYELDLTHESNTASDLTNNGNKSIEWEVRFYGNHDEIKVDDAVLKAEHKDINGVEVSYVTTTVAAGDTVHAEVYDATAVSVDKTALRDLYDTVKDAKKADYTAESWGPFEKALADAEIVLADADATQAEVDAAYAALKKAAEELELVKTGKPGDGKDDNKGEGAAETGDFANVGGALMSSAASLAAVAALLKRRKNNFIVK